MENVAWMLRKRVEAAFPACQASLTLDIIRCIVSVVHLLGLLLNCMGGNNSCVSVRKEMSAATNVQKGLLIVSRRPMGNMLSQCCRLVLLLCEAPQ